MSTTLSRRVREVFDAALERPASERRAYVESACDGDARAKDEVWSLLGALEAGGDALEVGAAACMGVSGVLGVQDEHSNTSAGVLGREVSGVSIGGFRLVRLVGTGGMGSVYEAEQEHPRRTVALKVMRTWANSPAARRRFVDEAQILARLQHPGVAQVFAAGSHALARGTPEDAALADVLGVGHAVPWIAMEFVEGAQPITAYAASKGLSTKERLLLFADVCDAVHHGHMKGVIHRDLKPANVLVNARGQVKVIDFGVARAAEGSAVGSAATVTGAGVLIGTLRYMSPEQCDGDPHGLDTRSDVYSLGVVLYELLTERLPYELGDGSFTGAVRAIREAEPAAPSMIRRALGGDLERIILKTLAKERERRYQSAADLAADVRRLLANEPIKARSAGWGYRAGKFARRNKAVVALAGLAAVAMVAGSVGVGVSLARAIRAEKRAELGRAAAEHNAYVANIVAADAAVSVHDGGTAMARLNAAPASKRGWEWGYLRGLADESVSRQELPPGSAESTVSPDGRTIVVCMSDEGVQCLERESLKLLWSVGETKNSGEVPRFSGDGKLVVVPEVGGATLLDAQSGRALGRAEFPETVLALGSALSPDGSLVALGCSASVGVRVFDAAGMRPRFGSESVAWVYSPDFSPDGSELATSENREVVIRDAHSGAVVRRFPIARASAAEPSPIRYSPDGRVLAVAVGMTIELHDTASGELLRQLEGHTQRVHTLAFDRAGRRLASGSVDKCIRIWSLENGAESRVLTGSAAAVDSIQFIPNEDSPGEERLWSSGNERTVRVWEPARRQGFSSRIDGNSGLFVTSVDFDAKGETLVAACGNGVVRWSVASGREIGKMWEGPANPASVFADAGLVCGMFEGWAALCMKMESPKPLWRTELSKGIDGASGLSPDGRWMGFTISSSCVRVVEAESGERVCDLESQGGRVKYIAFTREGDVVLTASSDGSARAWDRVSGQERARFDTPGKWVMCVAASPSEPLVASGGGDQALHLWDRRTGREVRCLRGFSSTVWSAAFSPDGSRLAVGSQDRLARVFDVATGDELLQLRGHTGTVMSLTWSDDGRYLATGGYDQRVFVWDGGARERSAAQGR